MKTLCTTIIALCITATTFAQTVTKQKTIIEISPEERAQIQEVKDVILDLSKSLEASLEEKNALNQNDITTLKKLLEAINEEHEGQKLSKEVVLKVDDPSEKTSISYAFSINRGGKTETINSIESIDMSQFEDKLSKLSISLSESDDIKLLVKRLNEKASIIYKEIEEKKEKTKH